MRHPLRLAVPALLLAACTVEARVGRSGDLSDGGVVDDGNPHDNMRWAGSTLLAIVNPGVPYGIAVDDTNVYFVDSDRLALMSLPKDGGAPPRAIFTGHVVTDLAPKSAVADGRHLFLATLPGVVRVERDGANPKLLYDTGGEPIRDLVGSGGVLYALLAGRALLAIDKDTGVAATLVARGPGLPLYGLAEDAERVYTVDGDAILSVDKRTGAIVPTVPQPGVDIGSGVLTPAAVAPDAFFLGGGPGRVIRVDRITATMSEFARINWWAFVTVVLVNDAPLLYWGGFPGSPYGQPSRIMCIPLVGGESRILADGPGQVTGFAVDDAWAYLAIDREGSGGEVRRMPKCAP